MKTIVCERPFSLTIEDRPRPKRRDGEVLLRIRRVGLCGTDYHIFAGRQPFFVYPRIMGHELAGEIVEAESSSDLTEGQIVTVNPYLPCGRCIACRKGKPNCCMFIRVLGVHADGGMCDYLSVPETAIVPVGTLSVDQAAMVEFLSVGAHAVGRAQPRPTDRVLIAGAGPIGVAVALFAAIAGCDVTLIDRCGARLAHASDAVGIKQVALVDEAIDATLAARTGGEFFDCVFDATGNAAAMRHGLSYVAHGGTYVLVSIVEDDLCFPDPEFHKREATLLGSRNATKADFANVIARISDGSIATTALHTHSLAAVDAPERVSELIADQGNVLKAIVTF